MNTQQLKRQIILNWIFANLKHVTNSATHDIDKYLKETPDEIKIWQDQQELDRIKFNRWKAQNSK